LSDERLEIVVESEASQASAEMDKLIKQFDILGSKLDKLTTTLQGPSSSISRNVKNIGKSVKSESQSIIKSLAKMSAIIYTLKRTFQRLGEWIKSAMDYQETVHLFSTVFTRLGKRAGEDFYEGFFDRINEFQSKFVRLGLDPEALMNYQAVFAQMADSMGVLPKAAYAISESFTALGADLSSLFNLPIEDAMLKLQSGLAGQIRPLRQLGIDISKTTLMEEARMRGITKSIEVMTASEKVQLRYLAIMRQTMVAHGDIAKTIMPPANSLRLLNQQLKMAGRAIGSIFLPIVQKLLPYLTAVAIVIRRIASAIAGFFGYELPKLQETLVFDYDDGILGDWDDGILGDRDDGILGDWDEEQDNIGKTSEKLKKLKSILMGFDEINILQDQSDLSSSGGGGTGGGRTGGMGAGASFDLSDEILKMNEEYQKMIDEVLGQTVNKAEEIADRLEKPFKNILKLVGLIGVGILSWKLADKLFKLFTGETTDKGLLASIYRIGKAIVKPSGKLLEMQSVLGNSTAYVATEAVIAGIAATIAIIVLRTLDLIKNSETFRKGLSTIYNGIKTGLSWIGEKFSSIGKAIANVMSGFDKLPVIGKLVEALDLDFADLLITLGGIGLLFTPAAPFGIALLGFEAITLAIRGIGYAASDAIEEVDVLGDGISDITKQKMEPFLNQMRDLDDTLTKIDWTNLKIDDSVVQDVERKTKAIVETILNELDSDRNEALKTLAPLRDALGEDAYNKLIRDNEQYYSDMVNRIKNGEARINEIMKKASEENRELTEEEKKEITRIRDEMNNIGIKHLSETEVEYNTIMRRLKDNSVRISLEQASEIIKNAKKTKEETIKEAETQYTKQLMEAQRMLDVGAINKDQYDAIVKAAKETRDKTIREAETQYNNIYNTTMEKLGNTAKYIDGETGNIKSKWQVFTDSLSTSAAEGWGNVKKTFEEKWNSIHEWLQNNVFPKFTKQYWKDKFWGIVDGAENALDELKRKFEGWKANIKTPHITWSYADGFKATGVVKNVLEFFNLPTTIPKLKVSWYAQGGFPDTGELFIAREAGPELVGSIGGRTAVVNNDQIVAAVSEGVAKAVSEVLGKGDSSGDVVLKIGELEFGRISKAAINKYNKQTGNIVVEV